MSTTSFKVVVVGDNGVGKSTLISLLLPASVTMANKKVPLLMERPVLIPPFFDPAVDQTSTSSGINSVFYAVDTRLGSSQMEIEVARAHCVVIVCDMSRPETIARVDTFWIPELARIRSALGSVPIKVPIIVALNKSDTCEFESPSVSSSVDACLTCTATDGDSIAEVFGAAQKATLFPLYPIFDSTTDSFSDDCMAALERSFRLLDRNGDGDLDNAELSQLQQLSAGDAPPLTQEEAEAIKRKIARDVPTGLTTVDESTSSNITGGGVTFDGFVYLQKKLCRMKKHDCVWRVLNHFGYDRSLSIHPSFLAPPNTLVADAPHQRIELSPVSISFLAQLFQRFDLDSDGLLSQTELSHMFHTTPQPLWPLEEEEEEEEEEEGEGLNLRRFLSNWRMAVHLNYRVAMMHLMILGLDVNDKPRAMEVVGANMRTVWRCFLLGSRGCGKTSILNALKEQRELKSDYVSSSCDLNSANTLTTEDGEHTLILSEFALEDTVVHDKAMMMGNCDVCCLAWDNHDPSSWAHSLHLHEFITQHYPSLPLVHVVTKADLSYTAQSTLEQPLAFLRSHGFQDPLSISLRSNPQDADKLFQTLIHTAVTAHAFTPQTAGTSIAKRKCVLPVGLMRAVSISLAIALAAVGSGFMIKVLAHKWRNSPLLSRFSSWMTKYFPSF